MKKMILLPLIVFIVFIQTPSFAKLAETAPQPLSPKQNIKGFVRTINGELSCVHFVENENIDTTALQIPLCPMDGDIGVELQAVKYLANSEGKVQMAFLSHAVAAVGGCAAGVITSFGGAMMAKENSKGKLSQSRGATDAALLVGAFPAALVITSDLTGHALLMAGGYAACSSGVIYFFLN